MEINWSAPEYEYRPKEVSWFWISIIVAVLVLALAVWQRNFLFGFFVVVAEILLIVWGSREPREINFSFSDKGLTVDGRKFYAWDEIQNWSARAPEESKYGNLLLNFKGRLKPDMRVLLPKSKFAEIRKAFAEKLPEVEWEESIIDTLERFLRF